MESTGQGVRRGRESEEREAARRRVPEGARAGAGDSPPRHPQYGSAPVDIAQRAFVVLAESVRDYAVFLLDPEGVITYWGESARLIQWWSREAAEGSHLRLLYPDGGGEDGTAEAHLTDAAELGECSGEGHRVRSDGSTFWAGVTLTALRDADGTLLGFVKVTRDLTAQRTADTAARAALEAAEEANRVKSQFLAAVSHEVRTPLTSIMAYTDLIRMELSGPLEPTYHRYLETVRSSSQHLLGLLDDILDLARTDAGRLSVQSRVVDAGRVAGQAMLVVEPHASHRQVELVDAISGHAGEYRCVADEERLRQILLNLMGNAIKFTERGGRVTVSAGMAAHAAPDAAVDPSAGPWLYFRVEDTGGGIPEDRITDIFEPFVQGDMSTTRRHGGTGLGLAISRRLARLMKGDVTVRSRVGVGSTFLVWLPAAPEPAAAGEPAHQAAAVQAGAGTLAEVRAALLANLERTLHAYVARLRSDPATPGARSVSETELEDHLVSFLADIAQTLGSMDLAAGVASDMARDGAMIQRTIAEHHGAQRARLGWAESEVRREFEILREELASAVRRHVQTPRPDEVEEILGVLQEFLERAEITALASYHATAAENGGGHDA